MVAELYELPEDELSRWQWAERRYQLRLARELDAGVVDGPMFARAICASRCVMVVLTTALAMRRHNARCPGQPVGAGEPVYRAQRRTAAMAVELADAWGRMDGELRDLLGGGPDAG